MEVLQQDAGLQMQLYVFLFQWLSSLFCLWLGIYLLKHATLLKQMDPLDAWQAGFQIGLAVLFGGIYAFGVTMEALAETSSQFLRWQRSTWWSAPFSLTFMYFGIANIKDGSNRQHVNQTVVHIFNYTLTAAASVAAATMFAGILATVGEHHVGGGRLLFTTRPRSPYYGYYMVYMLALLLLTAGLIVGRLRRSLGTDRQRRYWILALAVLTICLGAVAGIIGFSPWGILPRDFGLYGIICGAVLTSLSVARFQAFQMEYRLVRSFTHSLLSACLHLVAMFVVYTLLSAVGDGSGFVLNNFAALGPAAIIAASTRGIQTDIVDRWTLPKWAIRYRRNLQSLRREPVRVIKSEQLFSQAPTSFADTLEEARSTYLKAMISEQIDTIFSYRKFNNDELLAESPLNSLKQVRQRHNVMIDKYGRDLLQTDIRIRASLLRDFLTDTVNRALRELENMGATDSTITLWLLREQYIYNQPRKDIEALAQQKFGVVVAGGAHSRRITQARQLIADALFEAEIASADG